MDCGRDATWTAAEMPLGLRQRCHLDCGRDATGTLPRLRQRCHWNTTQVCDHLKVSSTEYCYLGMLSSSTSGVGSASAAAAGHSPGGSGHRAGAVARRVSTRLDTRSGSECAWLTGSGRVESKGRRVRRGQEAARRFHEEPERSSDFLCLPDLEDLLFCLQKKKKMPKHPKDVMF